MHHQRHHRYSIATLGQGKGKGNPLRHGNITLILTLLLDTETVPTAQSKTTGMTMTAYFTMRG
ncbi:hypothetical protein DY000_02052951 [Brassica cretica]|uniref:Uncharacterized protein n=1 Tax=Brassica cretica TaxID=69181 RepID=A0ABQ7A8U9_BRACR|nr:hypothetical protein DY000_02052951 [Brassica cretica]